MAVVIEVAAAVAAAAGGSSDMILKPCLALLPLEILICRAALTVLTVSRTSRDSHGKVDIVY